MSEKDLVKELKAEIAEITKDRDDALAKVKSKESRMKQVLIKLEHATQDVQTLGHKIGQHNKQKTMNSDILSPTLSACRQHHTQLRKNEQLQ